MIPARVKKHESFLQMPTGCSTGLLKKICLLPMVCRHISGKFGGDDIEVYSDDFEKRNIGRFFNLRNQELKTDGAPNLCLSDFIAPVASGKTDYLGAFAVTAGFGIEKILDEFASNLDDYQGIMVKALADRLAEAFTELIHLKVRKEFWGYAPDENLSLDDLLLEKYKGIRPAHGYPACPDHSEKETLFQLLAG